MLKFSRGTALLVLSGALIGGLTTTNASASTSKKVNSAISKISISNLANLNTTYASGVGVKNSIDPYNRFQTYKLKRSMKLTNEFKHKTATLPKGSVVTGYADKNGNLINVDNTTLSIHNQKRVKKLGNWHYSFPKVKDNAGATRKYTRKTAFSYGSLASVPSLSVKTKKAQYDGAADTLPFISVTADSQLVYHKKETVYKATRHAKIKKFKRSHSKLTFYLSKKVKGVTTKRVKLGKSHAYRVTLKYGPMFQSYDKYNGDPGAYNVTVKNGKQSFFVPIAYSTPTQSYIDSLTGSVYVSSADKKLATDYINGLH
ncbi:hypothetical protein [Levilactobacillus namurensis]|uniref:hypothetical protein n=1 Tax=Levilactobacillus namurensis TaxID=380393 RepID=UPI0004642957|nr:hypothetical protein [Levilactobacillus namurensis]